MVQVWCSVYKIHVIPHHEKLYLDPFKHISVLQQCVDIKPPFKLYPSVSCTYGFSHCKALLIARSHASHTDYHPCFTELLVYVVRRGSKSRNTISSTVIQQSGAQMRPHRSTVLTRILCVHVCVLIHEMCALKHSVTCTRFSNG